MVECEDKLHEGRTMFCTIVLYIEKKEIFQVAIGIIISGLSQNFKIILPRKKYSLISKDIYIYIYFYGKPHII